MAGECKQLLFKFQELCHYWSELGRGSRNEQECLILLELMEKIRLKWLEAHSENLGLKTVVESANRDVDIKKEQLKETKAQLIEARAQIASLISTKQAVEADRAELERQIELVRDLLKDDVQFMPEAKQKNYAFLQDRKPRKNTPLGSVSAADDADIDYDHTEESIEEETEISTLRNGRKWSRVSVPRNQKRRSRSIARLHAHTSPIQEDQEQPPKRSKVNKENGHFPRPNHTGSCSGHLEILRRSLNRSYSQPHLAGQGTGATAAPSEEILTPRQFVRSNADLRTPSSASSLRTWISGNSLNSRRHLFVGKTVLKPEYCDFCKKRVAFGKSALKCQDCHYLSHTECKNQVPLPCVPKNPSTPKCGRNGKLRDFTPSLPPMIPPLIIHCILELERRGLQTLGLYRIPGSESDVQELVSQFLNSRGFPNLRLVDDVHVVTGCIKRFLSQLREPLIPITSWHEFVRGAECKQTSGGDFSKLHQAIGDLPLPNKDTLAFLMMHLQKVAECAHENKMPVENLSKVLGPTVVGYSSEVVGMQEAIVETPKQEAVMRALLSLQRSYWDSFLTFPNSQPLIGGTQYPTNMPEPFAAPVGTRVDALGCGTPSGFQPPQKTGSSVRSARTRKGFFPPPWK